MPWPKDTERLAIARARHREAQRRRWTPEARARVAEVSRAQFSDPEQRRRMSEVKRALYRDRPEVRERIAASVSAHLFRKARARRARVAEVSEALSHHLGKNCVPALAPREYKSGAQKRKECRARVQSRSLGKAERLRLIRRRAVIVCGNAPQTRARAATDPDAE